MIKFKNQTSNNTISSDVIKDLIDTLPTTKSPIFKTENFTIRDLRIGSIIRIHLCNDSRGDKGYVTTEIVALFNSMGQHIYIIVMQILQLYMKAQYGQQIVHKQIK